MSPEFLEPERNEYEQLAKQWLGVVNLVREEYGVAFDQSLESLNLLQRVLDDDALETSNTYAHQCLGVAFGRILAKNVRELDWWSVDDEYGRSLCLRFKQSTLRINPITMISKRIERGEHVSVEYLYHQVLQTLEAKQDNVD